MSKLDQAVQDAQDPSSDEPQVTIEHHDWRELERSIRLNTPANRDQDCGPLRPTTPVLVDSLTVAAGKTGHIDFKQGVRKIRYQNNTPNLFTRSYTGKAGAGSLQIPADGKWYEDDVLVSEVYLYAEVADAVVNGSVTAGVVIEAFA